MNSMFKSTYTPINREEEILFQEGLLVLSTTPLGIIGVRLGSLLSDF